MPKLPRASGEEAIRALERLGFVRTRQRGSHVILKKQRPREALVALFHYIGSWPSARNASACVHCRCALEVTYA